MGQACCVKGVDEQVEQGGKKAGKNQKYCKEEVTK